MAAASGGVWKAIQTTDHSDDILLLAANSIGEDPFTTVGLVDSDAAGTTPRSHPPATIRPSNDFDNENSRACSYGGIVTLLRNHPADAATFLKAVNANGLVLKDVGALATLHPVVLPNDTRVTVSNFAQGNATVKVRQALLQRGSDVLANDEGAPIVRCASGTPLTAPTDVANPKYLGAKWPLFLDGGPCLTKCATFTVTVTAPATAEPNTDATDSPRTTAPKKSSATTATPAATTLATTPPTTDPPVTDTTEKPAGP